MTDTRAQLRDRMITAMEGAATALDDLPYNVTPYLADAVLPLWPDPDTLLGLVIQYGAARSNAADAANSGFFGDVRRYDAEADAIYARIRAALAGEKVAP